MDIIMRGLSGTNNKLSRSTYLLLIITIVFFEYSEMNG